jgi:putative glutamine amidotransferase
MTRPIFVSQRTVTEQRYGETRDALDQRWASVFSQVDILPLLVPNNAKVAAQMIDALPAQGILLTGGNDSPQREAAERVLLDFARQKRLPVLGICHGMQAIQRYFDVPVLPVAGHVAAEQTILIDGKQETVNSYHNLGATTTVDSLEIWARAADGVIKAIRHRDLPWVGIMWHPERCAALSARDKTLLTQHWGTP